jgi:transcriptional regulator with XRE-family HTH domain
MTDLRTVADGETGTGQRTFGELLRSHRITRGATQRQLADLSTVSLRAIRDLELGRVSRPRRDTVRLIAEGLGLGGSERAGFELAAHRVASHGSLKLIYEADPPGPPAPLGELVGREAELAALRDLLTAGSQRLVTITGLGGVGKTILALHLAGAVHRSRAFPVLWSSAAGVRTPYRTPNRSDQFAELIRAGIGGLFATAAPASAELAELIGQRPTLMVLDGYDPAAVRLDRVIGLLQACGGLRVLATAPAPFDVHGERPFPLLPLAVPRPGRDYNLASLARVPAAQLLLRHIREVQTDFELDRSNAAAIAALCQRLDGIPAALAAVASWFLVDDASTLLDYLTHDAGGLIEEMLPELREALCRALSGLRPAESMTLACLAGAEPGWSITDAVGLTGLPPVTCAGLVRRLLTLGLVRPADETDRTRFQVVELFAALRREQPLGGHLHAAAV